MRVNNSFLFHKMKSFDFAKSSSDFHGIDQFFSSRVSHYRLNFKNVNMVLRSAVEKNKQSMKWITTDYFIFR